MVSNAFSFQKRRQLVYAELYLSDGADQRDHYTLVVQIELFYCLHTQSQGATGQERKGRQTAEGRHCSIGSKLCLRLINSLLSNYKIIKLCTSGGSQSQPSGYCACTCLPTLTPLHHQVPRGSERGLLRMAYFKANLQ